ncbi:MAG: hypothetical protein R8G66_27260 [Cytophagales bacterium]|nr:hypothetical protein [Cytophagales bacterium]
MAKKQLKASCFIIVLIVLVGCTPEFLNERELNAYIQDTSHGLKKEKAVGPIGLSVIYRPTEFLIYQELGQDKDLNKRILLEKKYKDHVYFLLDLTAGDRDILYGASAGQADFSGKLQTLSFNMGAYTQLVTSKQDTIPVIDYIYNRNFGISKSSTLLFVFDKEKIEGAESFAFQLEEFGFNTGLQRFEFTTKDILSTPKLTELRW